MRIVDRDARAAEMTEGAIATPRMDSLCLLCSFGGAGASLFPPSIICSLASANTFLAMRGRGVNICRKEHCFRKFAKTKFDFVFSFLAMEKIYIYKTAEQETRS